MTTATQATSPDIPIRRPAGLPAAERYRDRLLRYVLRLTAGDSHRAEDIVQETMLRAWLADSRRAGDGDDERLAAWLHTVARNLAIDAHRRDRALPAGMVPSPLLKQPADGTEMADRVADRMLVTAALARLTPEHRAVLVHIHLHGRSGAEAARDLGIPQGTVKSRVHYALSALRREIRAA
ncbi:sigma-70 family RNA polymerase sigma factor [Streptomyces sp. RFCAC02]|uniref:sigma-70 family RNA polymerase sigma factor n=1 Tax=Streptomyces sp. RFCAC02 TaxID=2499143 RepID=UPI00101EC486|nr:sigma-70 family RNA polymerase sigma factor [Streptomyces sp. RFCAC02]